MSHSAETLVEERVLQLQEISKRRNELLREMYHLIQKRDHLGAAVSIEEDNDEGEDSLQLFLERFDLEKHPDTGHISSLSEDEVALPETPPAYSPVGVPDFEPTPEVEEDDRESGPEPGSEPELAAEPDVEAKAEGVPEEIPEPEPASKSEPEPESEPIVADISSESSMSEPPGSPLKAERQEEEEEEEEEEELKRVSELPQASPQQVDMDVDVDDEVTEAPVLSVVTAEDAETQEDVKEHMASPEATLNESVLGSPKRIVEISHPTDDGVPEKSPTPAQARSPSLIPNSTESEPPRRSPTPTKSPQSPSKVESPPTVPVTREPSVSSVVSAHEERLESVVTLSAHAESRTIKAEPLDDEPMDVTEEFDTHPVRQSLPLVSAKVPSPEPGSPPRPITKEYSEDQIMAILGPSQAQSSPPLEEDHHVSAAYSIPLPTISPSLLFSFQNKNGDEDTMDVEQQLVEPPFGPNPPYPLPPMSVLPVEFSRKRAPRRKRDKERDKGDTKEWQPMPLNRWAAMLKANPVHVKLAKAPKCLSTRDWSVGIMELRLMRTFERVEKLKETGNWSFRQPKKQRSPGSTVKTHWDYLMDEMKWMRTDFREERRWKIALAFNLGQAVVDWHRAGTLEERVRRGIVVLWKPPTSEDTEMADGGDLEQDEGPFRDTQDTDENAVDSRETDTPLDGYASDDESDDEQDKEQPDVLDNLGPSAVLQEALEQLEQTQSSNTPMTDNQDSFTLKPKVEDIEDATAFDEKVDTRDENAMAVDDTKMDGTGTPSSTEVAPQRDVPQVSYGLKTTSKNPILGSAVKDGDLSHSKSKHKTNQYAALRDLIVYSNLDKLFVDLDDLELAKGMSELSTEDPNTSPTSVLPPHDLTAVFPDFQPYGMLDVAPPSTAMDGRKKSDRKTDKDDPNKRADEANYSKLVPVSKFMSVKPTLVGTVKPASHFKNGVWTSIEDTPVFADVDIPSARPIEENLCALFEGTTASRSNSMPGHSLMPGPPRDGRKRNADHHNDVAWTPEEDALLKQAVDRYPHNWNLVADAFNSSRVTISTDRRTSWECLDRWKEKFSATVRADASEEHTPSASASGSASHMTTRGYKRSANQSVAAGSGSNNSTQSNEPRKRRRHMAINECMRKAMKKREQVLKSSALPRPAKSAVHDTHSQFNKMVKLTPAELSRMKAEKEARDAQEFLTRRRNDELTRQHLLREQAQRAQGIPPNAQPPQTPVQQTQMLPPSAGANGVSRPPNVNGVNAQMVQQIRSQVGISQQQQHQRLAVALANASANARMSPPQLSAAQAAHLRAMAAAAQGQGQAQQAQVTPGQGQAQSQVANASVALTPATPGAHLSPPPFAARATSSSPGVPHQSPPLTAASPPSSNANAGSLSRPPSGQQVQVQGTAVNPLMQVPAMATQYYLHGLQQQRSVEQLQALLAQRAPKQKHAPHVRQLQQQAPHQTQQYVAALALQQQQAAAAAAAAQQNLQKPPNGNFSLS